MGKRDPRIDAYIGKSADFARPILTHIRAVVHEACPDVEETLKWQNSSFMYHGFLSGFTEAKTDATRSKRIATAVEWMSEGKQRNWKYMKQQ